RSDVWSLGTVLYELLTLRRAFPAQTPEQSRQLIEANVPTPPTEHVTNVPRTLVAIFERATRSQPDQRYPSALALAQDLRRWLAFQPTKARPVWPWERLLLWARRSLARAIATVIATVLAFATCYAAFLVVAANLRLETARTSAAIERANLAEKGERAKQREILM